MLKYGITLSLLLIGACKGQQQSEPPHSTEANLPTPTSATKQVPATTPTKWVGQRHVNPLRLDAAPAQLIASTLHSDKLVFEIKNDSNETLAGWSVSMHFLDRDGKVLLHGKQGYAYGHTYGGTGRPFICAAGATCLYTLDKLTKVNPDIPKGAIRLEGVVDSTKRLSKDGNRVEPMWTSPIISGWLEAASRI